MLDFDRHIFCVITGGSRGIGQKIAVEFARKATIVTFLLLARSESGLSQTKSLIEEVNTEAVIFCKSLDLSEPNTDKFRQVLANSFEPNLYETAIIFHNAAQIGQIDKTSKLDNAETWRNFYNLNLFSVTLLNSLCLQMMKDLPELFVVNITSTAGREPFKYLSMYGSSKAARDLYFKVLALEEPEVTVLNYSPGLVDTAMAEELVNIIKNYEDNETSSVINKNPKLTPEQTTLKLISLLETGLYNSGDVIDYYDELKAGNMLFLK